MLSPRLFFENKQGFKLAAYLDVPQDRQPIAYALYAHCFTCSKNLKTMIKMVHSLRDKGIAILRFDFTGIGESQGDFTNTNLSSNVQDILAAAEFLHENYSGPEILIGHSLGGSAILQAANHLPSAKAVVTIAAPHDPSHLGMLLNHTKKQAGKEGFAEVTIGGSKFRLSKEFFEDLEQTRMSETIKNLNKALLILHSPDDTTVPIEHALKILQDANYPKSFISLPSSDHLLSRESDAIYVSKLIAAWISTYIHE